MKSKLRKQIAWETFETTIIRFKQSYVTAYCAKCKQQTPHLTTAQAFSILPLSELEIYRAAENGQFHSRETDGWLLLCGNSITAFKPK